jgi:hypothetical protein
LPRALLSTLPFNRRFHQRLAYRHSADVNVDMTRPRYRTSTKYPESLSNFDQHY